MAITEKYSSPAGAGANDGSSEANAWSWTAMITAVNALGVGGGAGLRVNHKGNVTRTASDNMTSGGGTFASPFILRGYLSTIGDGYLGRTSGNGPLITTNVPTITYNAGFRMSFGGSATIIESMNFAGNVSAGTILGSSSSQLLFRSCISSNSSSNSAARAFSATGTNVSLADCDFTLSGSGPLYCVDSTGTFGRIIACRINGGGNPGIKYGTPALRITGNTIFNCSVGIDVTTITPDGDITYNTIAGCTGNGIQFVTAMTHTALVFGNLITDGSSNAIQCTDTSEPVMLIANRFDRNTANIANGGDWVTATQYNQNTTSATQANEYANYAGNDFRLLAGSPARGNGLPAWRDIGALQHQDGPIGVGLIIPRRDSW